jgi:hypothetical protein
VFSLVLRPCVQTVLGGIGTESHVLSSLKRPTTCVMSASTREQEMRRMAAPDESMDRHGPGE